MLYVLYILLGKENSVRASDMRKYYQRTVLGTKVSWRSGAEPSPSPEHDVPAVDEEVEGGVDDHQQVVRRHHVRGPVEE